MDLIDNKKNIPLILIVGDNQKNLQVLGNILLDEECEISLATNGVEALEFAKKNLPDLILLDIMMPEMDGFEACRKLKESDKTKGIPIMFLTAKTESEDIAKGFELGAVDYVTKPFQPIELLSRVRTHLDLKLSRDALLKSDNEKKELIHILCHDLANPFAQIDTILQLVKTRPELFDSIKDRLHNSVKNGMELINLVRKMQKIDEKKFRLEKVNLLSIINDSISILEYKFTEKNIKLNHNINKSINITAESTSFLNSVISNLITNAIKFSHPGSEIDINADKEDNMVRISIKDYGIGMPDSILNTIFNPAKTNSRPGTSGETGTGFGLPLVKKFIDAYGGSIEVISKEKSESPDKHGTEVIMHLKQS